MRSDYILFRSLGTLTYSLWGFLGALVVGLGILSRPSLAFVELFTKRNNYFQPGTGQMFSSINRLDNSLEERKVSFLRRREKSETVKEGHYYVTKSAQVVNGIIPYPVPTELQPSCLEVSLHKRQDGLIFLRDIEGQIDLPAKRIFGSGDKCNIEAALTVHETAQIPANSLRNLYDVFIHASILSQVFPADCLHRRIVTHHSTEDA